MGIGWRRGRGSESRAGLQETSANNNGYSGVIKFQICAFITIRAYLWGGWAKGALIMKMGGGGQFFGSNTNLIIGKKIKPIAPCYRRFVTGVGISNNQ